MGENKDATESTSCWISRLEEPSRTKDRMNSANTGAISREDNASERVVRLDTVSPSLHKQTSRS